MASRVEKIEAALREVLYFAKGADIVTLQMVRNISVDGQKISFTLVLPKEDKKSQPVLEKLCQAAIHNNIDENAEVHVNFMVEHPSLTGVKHIIAIGSGKGGVGKSTVAANLAVALHKLGNRVGILDADIFGPSIPIMFNVADKKPMIDPENEQAKIIPVENHGIKIQSVAFFVTPEQALIWRGPMASNALNQLIGDTQWGELDYLVVDLPPGTSDIHLTMVQQYKIDGIIIVSTPQEVALADARKAFSMFRQESIRVPVLGLVENMSYFSPPETPEKRYYLFGKMGGRKLADQERINLLGEIPIVESICESGDSGNPVAQDMSSPVYQAFMNLAVNVQAIIEKQGKN
jgi:ATP-binding protein involved in chromosome partitioning